MTHTTVSKLLSYLVNMPQAIALKRGRTKIQKQDGNGDTHNTRKTKEKTRNSKYYDRCKVQHHGNFHHFILQI